MFTPERINLLKNEEAFSLAHQPWTQLLNLAFFKVIGVAQLLLKEGLEIIH